MTENTELISLFPTIIYRQSNAFQLTTEELEFIENVEFTDNGLGNIISKDTFLLNSKELKRLKDTLTLHANNYLNEVMNIKQEVYITNSWLNVTHKDKDHSLHNHSNSILSGVFYISASDSLPKITFKRDDFPFLLNMKAEEYHGANSVVWDVSVSDNDIIIFPSKVLHAVKHNPSNQPRISLAFNSFVKGTIGADGPGADLIIK